MCGQSIALHDGYEALDYRSRGNAEIPRGAFLYRVRSVDERVRPSSEADGIFRVLPDDVADLIVGTPYKEWFEGWKDLKAQDDDSIDLGLLRFEAGCTVSVSLVYRSHYLYPRSGDWAIKFYESRPD